MARDDEGKRPFLIGYDYGMGGLWGVMYARSTEEIKDHYPELVVVNEWPKWMDNDEFTRMAENAYDIDGPPWGVIEIMLADEEDEKRKRSLSTDDAGLLASLSSFSVKARREFSSLMSSISGSDGIWREFTKDLERDWPDFMARVGYPPVPVSVVSFFVKSDTPEVSDSDRRMVREALEFAVSAGGGFPVYQVLIASRDTYTRIGQEWMKRGFWAWANYKWLSFADTFRDGLYGPTAAATNEEGLTQWAGVLVFDSMDELVSSFSQPVSTLAPLVVGGKSLDIQTILDRLVESPKAAQPGHWTNYRVPELIRVAAGSGGLVVQQRSMSEHNRVDIFIPSGPKDSPAT